MSLIQESKPAAGAPKWVPAYASLNTILLAFFIVLSVNMGKTRALGYLGPGLGAFQQGFNSKGLPGILTGAKRIASLFTVGGKYVPEKTESREPAAPIDERMIEAPEPDLKELLAQLSQSDGEVALPLPIPWSDSLDDAAVQRLAAAAKLVRQSDRTVLVFASLPMQANAEETWLNATRWAQRVAQHLCEMEGLPAQRVSAVGAITTQDPTSSQKARPALVLIMRRPGISGAAPGLHTNPPSQRHLEQ